MQLAEYRAGASEEDAAAETLNRRLGSFLVPGHPASKPEQQLLLQQKGSTAKCSATPHAQSWPREPAPVSSREAAAPSMKSAEHDMPLSIRSASQRCMSREQDPAGKQALASSATARGDLIASIVETGLQIATRMGDRGAVAALCMPEPARATSGSAARTTSSRAGIAKDAPPGNTPAAPRPHASKHALPAPGDHAGQQKSGEHLAQGAGAAEPGKGAKQSIAVNEHEPTQPDAMPEGTVPTCQGVLSAAQRERLRQWTFLDGHTTVRERARRAEGCKARTRAPRRSSRRQAAARAAEQDHAAEPGGALHASGASQQAEPGKRKRAAAQHSILVLRRSKVVCAGSSSDIHQQQSQERSGADGSACKAVEGQQEPEVSSSMDGDCAGCSSVALIRGTTALQRLASIALKL